MISTERIDNAEVTLTPDAARDTYAATLTQPGTTRYAASGTEPRRITMSDGSYVAYDYDGSLRLVEERYYNSSQVLTQKLEYDYDAAGNRTSRTVGGALQSYTSESDSAYKLDKVTDASGGGGTLRVYNTDGASRVTGIDSDTLAYNAAGRVYDTFCDAILGRCLKL